MYESFYGLTGKPFQLNPDPAFYFASSQHRRARSYIDYGLHQSEGFIVVTGEVGAGKTTMVRSMLGRLDPAKMVAGTLVSTQLDAEDTLRMVAASFGVPTRDRSKSDLLLTFEAQLASHATQGRRCILVVDEAQNLTQRAVEELRMLSNFQLGTHALLQTFLVGQPEFRLVLQSPEMNQLRQRVIAACHIGPLSADETRQYIEHRLTLVGWRDSPRITSDAFVEIHHATGGIPRRINLLCDRLLLSGYLAERREFNSRAVLEVSGGITSETSSSARQQVVDGATERHDPVREPVTTQLQTIENSVKDLEATLSQLDLANDSTTLIMRRFVELLRTRIGKGPEH